MTRLLAHPALHLALFVVIALTLSSCVSPPPRPSSIMAETRVDRMRELWPGLRAPATIRYDEHLIPFIEVADESDAPYTLGLVHAHLRLTQMDLFRRVSRGRLAESAGPIAAPIDEAIRAFDLDRAVPEMARQLPPDTRAWIERYVEGVNDYRRTLASTPADFDTLGFSLDEEWTVEDVLAFGRLACVDVNWGRWLALIPLRNQKGYEDFAARLWAFADDGVPSYGPETPTDLDLLMQSGRTGSNAFAVDGRRSATGSAIVASDPHLGLPQPNIWCVVAYRTPTKSVAGLTMPGLPFVVVGRNEHIAWTGTNMQASSSVLYRLPPDWQPVSTRTEPIGVRLWFDQTAEIRESAFGPVISDASLLSRLGDGDFALGWRGHRASDEASAFLRASHATNWDEFRVAFATFATGGQNILFGDTEGNIGQLMAVEAFPAAARASRDSPVPPSSRYLLENPVAQADLPVAFNPEVGFLASSNNVPMRFSEPLVAQGNANDRLVRIQSVLADISAERLVTTDDLRDLQRDVFSAASLETAQTIVTAASRAGIDPQSSPILLNTLRWDGHYTEDSVGAASYQRLLDTAIEHLYTDRYSSAIIRTMRSGAYVHEFVRQDIEAAPSPDALRTIVDLASIDYDAGQTWGDLHRLNIAHPLANVPVIGSRYTFDNLPSAGTTTTIHKAAHSVSSDRHQVTFGANARLICDMSSPDANTVVLLGGQDGQLGSPHLLDQIPLWRRGDMIPLPLTREGQIARAVRSVELVPASKAAP